MRVKDVRAYLDRELIPLAERLGLEGWTIRWEVHRLDEGRAEVRDQPEYRWARITVDAGQIRDEADLAKVMRHELLHIVHSPTENLFNCLRAMLPEGSPEGKLLRETARQTAEYLVVNLERMYQGLTRHGQDSREGDRS